MSDENFKDINSLYKLGLMLEKLELFEENDTNWAEVYLDYLHIKYRSTKDLLI